MVDFLVPDAAPGEYCINVFMHHEGGGYGVYGSRLFQVDKRNPPGDKMQRMRSSNAS